MTRLASNSNIRALSLAAYCMVCLATTELHAAHIDKLPSPGKMALTSFQVKNNGTFQLQQIDDRNGCKGKNISPALSWQGAPNGTRSYSIVMQDPDDFASERQYHWVVVNIPSSVTQLPLNAGAVGGENLPARTFMVANRYGVRGYTGSCPPDISHRYPARRKASPNRAVI